MFQFENFFIDVSAEFSNTQTLSSPYTHLVRVLVPLRICDEAAKVLVQVLGGEDKAREIVGGVKWWQVRGIEGWACLGNSMFFVRLTSQTTVMMLSGSQQRKIGVKQRDVTKCVRPRLILCQKVQIRVRRLRAILRKAISMVHMKRTWMK